MMKKVISSSFLPFSSTVCVRFVVCFWVEKTRRRRLFLSFFWCCQSWFLSIWNWNFLFSTNLSPETREEEEELCARKEEKAPDFYYVLWSCLDAAFLLLFFVWKHLVFADVQSSFWFCWWSTISLLMRRCSAGNGERVERSFWSHVFSHPSVCTHETKRCCVCLAPLKFRSVKNEWKKGFIVSVSSDQREGGEKKKRNRIGITKFRVYIIRANDLRFQPCFLERKGNPSNSIYLFLFLDESWGGVQN